MRRGSLAGFLFARVVVAARVVSTAPSLLPMAVVNSVGAGVFADGVLVVCSSPGRFKASLISEGGVCCLAPVESSSSESDNDNVRSIEAMMGDVCSSLFSRASFGIYIQ